MHKLASGSGASALALLLSVVSLSASAAEVGTYFTQPPGGGYEVEVPGGAGVQISPNRLRMMADPRGPRGESTGIEVVFEGAAVSPLQPKGRIEGDLIYWYSGAIGNPALAVPRFAALEQKEIHSGIDLAVTLERGRIKKRFALTKGADLSELRLRIETRGAQPTLTSAGALLVGDVLFQPTGATFIALGGNLYGLAAAGAASEVALSIDYAAWLVEAGSAPQPRLGDHPNLLAQLPGARPGDLLVFRTGTPPASATDSAAKGGGTVFPGGDYACGPIVLGPGDTLDPSTGAFTNVLALVVPAGVTVGVAPGGSLLDVTAAYVRIDGTLDLNGSGEAGGPAVPGTGNTFVNSPGLAGQGPGAGQGGSGGGFFDEVVGSGGGGYGNLGGAGGLGDEPVGTPGAGGATYGMALPPGIEPGSGGASGVANEVGPSGAGGAGGGALTLVGNAIRIGGLVRADGAAGGASGDDASGGGGGAGGGILLQASRNLLGNGTVAARGGGGGASDSFSGGSGGGAGGRIKFTGALDPGSTIASLVGGGGGSPSSFGTAGTAGGPGSIDTSTTTPPNPGGANVTVCGDPVAELRLTKSVDNDLVFVGDTVVYTLLVENIGPTTATGISVTDALPAGMTPVSTSGCVNDPNGSPTCQLADLGPGASTSYTLTATVVLDPGPGLTDTITNTAVVSLAETDPVLADNESTVVVTVQGAPLVTLTKVGPPTAVAGQTVTYTIEVSNGGPWDALGVVVNDTPPAGLTFNSATAPCAGGFPCAIGTIANGASVQFDVTFDIASNVLGDVTNTANVTASNIPVPDPAVHTATATTTIQAVADLSIAKADSVDPVVAGTPLSYTVTVTNAGPSDATAVTVTDTLPAGVTLVSTAGCAQDPVGVPTCTLGTIAAGGMAAYTINVTVNASTPPGIIQNTAVVSSAASDPNAANNTAIEPTTVQTVADLSITKVDSADPVAPGQAFSYTVSVSNAGPSDAMGVIVTDTLPAGVTLVSTAGCAEDPTGVPTCTLGTVAAGGMGVYTINVTVDDTTLPGVLENTASVTASTTDPDASNNATTETTTVVSEANVTGTKTAGATGYMIGDVVDYQVILTNTGSTQFDNPGPEFEDVLPPELALIGATASSGVITLDLPGNTVSWNGVITGGSSVTIDIQAELVSGTIFSTVLNQGTINYDADGDGINEAQRLTDDPALGGGADPTGFIIGLEAVAVPTVGLGGLVLMTLVLLAGGLGFRRFAARQR